jgi:(2Fe-2S) ferredoxin
MLTAKTPHPLHILVCTNARHDGTPSCGDSGEAQRVFEQLKARFKEAKLPIRVSRTGCLGPCAQGPNVMCYPQGMWLQAVGESDIPELEALARELLSDKS